MHNSEAPMRHRGGQRWRVTRQVNGQAQHIDNHGLLDEVVVGDWLHLEKLDPGQWWLRVGDADVAITLEAGGAVRVDVTRGGHRKVHGSAPVPD